MRMPRERGQMDLESDAASCSHRSSASLYPVRPDRSGSHGGEGTLCAPAPQQKSHRPRSTRLPTQPASCGAFRIPVHAPRPTRWDAGGYGCAGGATPTAGVRGFGLLPLPKLGVARWALRGCALRGLRVPGGIYFYVTDIYSTVYTVYYTLQPTRATGYPDPCSCTVYAVRCSLSDVYVDVL